MSAFALVSGRASVRLPLCDARPLRCTRSCVRPRRKQSAAISVRPTQQGRLTRLTKWLLALAALTLAAAGVTLVVAIVGT